MVRTALKDTRRILGQVTEGSPLYEMILEIFNLFSGHLGDDDDNARNVQLGDSSSNDGKNRLELLALPKFVNYFKVSNEDDDYLDQFIDKVSVIAEQEYYVDHGVDFNHLIRELHTHGFLLGQEITEKEPGACLQAQIMLQIMIRLRLITEDDLFSDKIQYKDVNDMDELRGAVND